MQLPEPGRTYADTRQRLIDLLAGDGRHHAAVTVAACPAWSVADTVAHVVGIIEDLRDGRVEGLGSDAWTAAQVERHRGHDLAEICEVWTGLAPFVDELAARDPWMVTRLIADLVTHEHDIRGALGLAGARDSDAVTLGLVRYAPFFVERVAAAGLATVAVVSPTTRWGDEDAAVELRAGNFELLRALTGRRSRAQVAALDWRGGPHDTHVPLISPYGQPADDLLE